MNNWFRIAALAFFCAASANAQIKYAGIYFGDLSGDYYSDSGAMAVMVRSNKQATLVGSAYGTNSQIGLFAQFKVQDDGTWSFNTNGVSGSGQIFTDGTITANFNFDDGSISTLDNGILQDDLGPYQNQAGLYAGSWSAGGTYGGRVFAVLSALGEIDLCAMDGNQPMDGGGPGGPLDSSNGFDFLTVSGTELSGALTKSTLTISGVWTSADTNGTFHLTRTASVAPNLPPTITSAPKDKTIPYGNNAAFSVTATGAAPLYYQWYSNDVALAGATSQLLIISNVQLSFDGTVYKVIVSNFVDTAQAEATLNAVPEITPPTITIVSPTAGQRVSSPVFHITGHATDNNALDSVYYSLNGGPDSLASGTSDWSADVALTPGTNVVAAHALDTSGNYSPTRRVTFVYVVSSTLTLITNGIGGITHGFTGNVLEIGRTYSVTAVPGAGQVFSNWQANGSVVAGSATYLFQMETNLVLQANFVPNPFLSVQGHFTGLFGQTTNRSHAHSGFFSLVLGDHGAYTGALLRGTNSYPFSGKFNAAGYDSRTVTVGGSPWSLTLALNLSTGQKLGGTVGTASWTADVLANRAVFNGVTNPASRLKGRYTLIFPGNDNASVAPGGDGYATIVVGLGGSATVSGFLADNQSFSQIVPLSGDGEFAFYAPLYGGAGSAWGWFKFDGVYPAAHLDGDVSWIRPAMATKYYPAGFTNTLAAGGSRYTQPAAHTRAIALTNGIVSFDGGNLSAPFTNQVSLTDGNAIINNSANKLKMSINITNGVFSGTVVVPNVARTNTFKGALLQDESAGFGYFLGTDQIGRVFFGAP